METEKELRDNLRWLRAEMQSATVALGRDDGDDWQVNSFNCAVNAATERIAELRAEVVRLQGILDLYPKRDGKPLISGSDPGDGTAERLGVEFRFSAEGKK